jgi:MFS family permease
MSAQAFIRKGDGPAIYSSLICIVSFIAYGMTFAGLGPALPLIAIALDKTEAQLGLYFTMKGLGYLFGTLASAYCTSVQNALSDNFSKHFLASLCIALSGVCTSLVAASNSFSFNAFLFLVQGLGFGGVEVFANCALPEIWGSRVGPWMQALHAFFGVG